LQANLPDPIPENNPPKMISNGLRFVLDILQTIVLALLLYFAIDLIIARVKVDNISMKPTLQPGEFLLINKFSYKFGAPGIGDIIVFHYPLDPQRDFIKRVIGLAGDTVQIGSGKVLVNGQALEESYISAEPSYDGTWKVPEGYLFVLGDNRNQSSDSHIWGFVPDNYVLGKALVIYWPITNLRILTHPAIVNAAH
jgi:signal peptidase I